MCNTANQAMSLANFAAYRINMFSPVHILVDCNTKVLVAEYI